MSVNLEILTRPFPREAIKTRKGGGGMLLSYVEGHTVIHRLNEATGNNWSLSILDISERGIAGKALVTVRVALTLPGMGSREALGVQLVSDNGGEDLVKGAVTDALKKAATMFGVGLELYGPHYEGAPPAPIIDESERARLQAVREARDRFLSVCDQKKVPYRGEDGKISPPLLVRVLTNLTGAVVPPDSVEGWDACTKELTTRKADPARRTRQPSPPPDMTPEELEYPFLGEEVVA